MHKQSDALEQNQDEVMVVLEGRDEIRARQQGGVWKMSFVGCTELSDLIKSMRKSFGHDVQKWPLPEGNQHSAMMIRELILKTQGKWNPPYKAEEICHCRKVPTESVDQAILAGAHDSAKVSRWTSASTACGTCRPDVEKLIEFRISGKASAS